MAYEPNKWYLIEYRYGSNPDSAHIVSNVYAPNEQEAVQMWKRDSNPWNEYQIVKVKLDPNRIHNGERHD